MTAFVARKFFSEIVSVTADTPVSLASLLRTAGWGKIPTTNNGIGTEPSMDSFLGARLLIIPATAILYLGHDTYVRNAAGAGPPRVYAGVPIAIAGIYELFGDPVDPESIWVYSVGTQNVGLVFYGV